jgi:hypothetical protein
VFEVGCPVFPGEEGTEVRRGGLAVWVSRPNCDSNSLLSIWEGTGELNRSKVSTTSRSGGDSGRPGTSLSSAGKVREREIGARRLRFVKLAGRSSSRGDSALGRDGGLGHLTGDEVSRSTTS